MERVVERIKPKLHVLKFDEIQEQRFKSFSTKKLVSDWFEREWVIESKKMGCDENSAKDLLTSC